MRWHEKTGQGEPVQTLADSLPSSLQRVIAGLRYMTEASVQSSLAVLPAGAQTVMRELRLVTLVEPALDPGPLTLTAKGREVLAYLDAHIPAEFSMPAAADLRAWYAEAYDAMAKEYDDPIIVPAAAAAGPKTTSVPNSGAALAPAPVPTLPHATASTQVTATGGHNMLGKHRIADSTAPWLVPVPASNDEMEQWESVASTSAEWFNFTPEPDVVIREVLEVDLHLMPDVLDVDMVMRLVKDGESIAVEAKEDPAFLLMDKTKGLTIGEGPYVLWGIDDESKLSDVMPRLTAAKEPTKRR